MINISEAMSTEAPRGRGVRMKRRKHARISKDIVLELTERFSSLAAAAFTGKDLGAAGDAFSTATLSTSN